MVEPVKSRAVVGVAILLTLIGTAVVVAIRGNPNPVGMWVGYQERTRVRQGAREVYGFVKTTLWIHRNGEIESLGETFMLDEPVPADAADETPFGERMASLDRSGEASGIWRRDGRTLWIWYRDHKFPVPMDFDRRGRVLTPAPRPDVVPLELVRRDSKRE
jgi:hypothetical protein